MTNPIQGRVLEYLDAVEAALSEHGDAIVDGALMWARIDAASGLIQAFASLIAVSIGAYAYFRFVRWGMTERTREGRSYASTPFNEGELGFAAFLVGGIGGMVGGGAAIFALIEVFNIWRWVGIFQPEMWIVHRAMNAVGG